MKIGWVDKGPENEIIVFVPETKRESRKLKKSFGRLDHIEVFKKIYFNVGFSKKKEKHLRKKEKQLRWLFFQSQFPRKRQ